LIALIRENKVAEEELLQMNLDVEQKTKSLEVARMKI